MVHIKWPILHVSYNLCRELFWEESGPVWKRNGPFPVYNLDFRSSDFRSLFLILVVWRACSNKSSFSLIYKPYHFSVCIIRKFIWKLHTKRMFWVKVFHSSSVQFLLVHINYILYRPTWYGPYDMAQLYIMGRTIWFDHSNKVTTASWPKKVEVSDRAFQGFKRDANFLNHFVRSHHNKFVVKMTWSLVTEVY